MGRKLDKFLLLMWKNWLLQYRKPIQTLVELLAPVLFCILLVVIRSLVDPEYHGPQLYKPFCVISTSFTDPPECNPSEMLSLWTNQNGSSNGNQSGLIKMNLAFSPKSEALRKAVDFLGPPLFNDVLQLENSKALEEFFLTNSTNSTFCGIQFDDSYFGLTNLSSITDLKVSIRFPAELRNPTSFMAGFNNWKTNLIFPVFQVPGPRSFNSTTGASPKYFKEGFLTVQQLLTYSLILAQNGFERDSITSNFDFLLWLQKNPLPMINMQRFAYTGWYQDMLLTALQSMIGIILMLSFVYTCINTVKTITAEKEKQLKEAMKIMGLPNWLHWTAWFVKTFVFLFFSSVLIVVLLKVHWYSNTDFTVFTHANQFVLLLFLVFYSCSIVTFCFAVSVFFSRANTAATVSGLAWFMSYAPYMFMQQGYDTLTLPTKVFSSLASNTAMAFGFQIMLMYEGTGEGIQWHNIFTPTSPDDDLSLGIIMLMLLFDAVLYLLVALYVEAVMPGEYGVPKPWYFLFTSDFWCGPSIASVENFDSADANTVGGEFFEKEPRYLHAGVEIRNVRKVFGQKAAVRNLSLNMYEDQITVLLGHNGAGKTTTMSMLTGMITPSSGTAKVNGHDIRKDMSGVRSSLGLCPQHNIIFDELTVSEHLRFYSKLKGVPSKDIPAEIDKYLQLLELEPKRNAKSSTLSGGMKRKLCVGIALCGNSKVVMLDEPTAGMDPSARRAIWDLLQSQKRARTILLTTHFMDEADLLGDRIAIMAGGEMQCCGSSFFLKKKYGAGYRLIMDKRSGCDPNEVTAALRRFIPDIEVQNNIGSELTYLLVENQSSLFEPMLRHLESNSESLGINSYGISLTTLEEVFMKVGADHGQEEMYNNDFVGNGHTVDDLNRNNFGENTVKVVQPHDFADGFELVKNQFLAMLLKKVLSTWRSWILLLIQISMPVLFFIIAIVVVRNQQKTGNLPARSLSLNDFEDSVTTIEKGQNQNSEYTESYKHVLSSSGYKFEETDDMDERMIQLTEETPKTVRRRYIAGASFNTSSVTVFGIDLDVPSITSWFNNDPYHSPGSSLALVLNAVYGKLVNDKCPDCSIEFTNHPLPYSISTRISQLTSNQSMGFQLAFNIGFSMAFVTSFYVLFVVRENTCKSKHLQLVSGVKIYVFWLTSALCDMATYVITVIALLITMLCFQEEGFDTAADIVRMFFILFYFGWAFIPLLYLSGFLFEVPSTGYTRMTLFSIFTGVAAFLIVQILSTDGLDLEYVGNALHWLFLLFPHYSLANGISETYTTFYIHKVCNLAYEACLSLRPNITREQCFESMNRTRTLCVDIKGYYDWEAPGIGRNVIYSFLSGTVMFCILLIVDYKLFSKLVYKLKQKYFSRIPPDTESDDSDVAKEKQKIREASNSELFSEYTLVLRDLTKYYKKFLAVNSLCLGVRKYECFGLLGINGAGKTTTFKMMTGDVKITYGNGFVNGVSIKDRIKEVQKFIGYCPQFDALLDDMTARETIAMFCLLRGLRYKDCKAVAEGLAVEFDFFRHLDKKVKELSGGNKRKLSTSISIIGDPPVVFLDEPTTGMDPATKRYLWNAICRVRDSGKCIVLTSHSMEECEALCTRQAIMVNGSFKCLGSTQHLKSKFAEGYTLTIKIKKVDVDDRDQNEQPDTGDIEKYIGEHFPGAKLREKHRELLNYYITDKSVTWSRMFGILEEAKRKIENIEDYSLGQSSLEQVFLTFTKYQY